MPDLKPNFNFKDEDANKIAKGMILGRLVLGIVVICGMWVPIVAAGRGSAALELKDSAEWGSVNIDMNVSKDTKVEDLTGYSVAISVLCSRPSMAGRSCVSGHEGGGRCFYLFEMEYSMSRSWAQSYCKLDGLAVIDNKEQNEVVAKYFKSKSPFWIGLRRPKPDAAWVLDSGEKPKYLNFNEELDSGLDEGVPGDGLAAVWGYSRTGDAVASTAALIFHVSVVSFIVMLLVLCSVCGLTWAGVNRKSQNMFSGACGCDVLGACCVCGSLLEIVFFLSFWRTKGIITAGGGIFDVFRGLFLIVMFFVFIVTAIKIKKKISTKE